MSLPLHSDRLSRHFEANRHVKPIRAIYIHTHAYLAPTARDFPIPKVCPESGFMPMFGLAGSVAFSQENLDSLCSAAQIQARYECLRNPQFYLDTLFLRKEEDTQNEMAQARTFDFDLWPLLLHPMTIVNSFCIPPAAFFTVSFLAFLCAPRAQSVASSLEGFRSDMTLGLHLCATFAEADLQEKFAQLIHHPSLRQEAASSDEY
jgi:hypothetical protein